MTFQLWAESRAVASKYDPCSFDDGWLQILKTGAWSGHGALGYTAVWPHCWGGGNRTTSRRRRRCSRCQGGRWRWSGRSRPTPSGGRPSRGRSRTWRSAPSWPDRAPATPCPAPSAVHVCPAGQASMVGLKFGVQVRSYRAGDRCRLEGDSPARNRPGQLDERAERQRRAVVVRGRADDRPRGKRRQQRLHFRRLRGEIASVRDGARTVRTLSARRFQRAAPRPPRPRRRCAATRLLQQMTQADPQQPSAHFFFDEQKDMWSILARRCVCGAPRCGTGRRLGRVPTRAMDPRGPAHSFGRFRGARRRRGVDPA